MPFRPPGGGGGGGSINTINSSVPTIAVTAPTGPTTTLDLETAAANIGSFGTRFVVPRVTVDTYGRVTAVANQAQILMNALPYSITALTGVSSPVSLTFGVLYDLETMTGPAPGNLPAANSASAGGANSLILSRQDQSANSFTIAPNGTDTIGGSTTPIPISPGESVTLVTDGTSNWLLI